MQPARPAWLRQRSLPLVLAAATSIVTPAVGRAGAVPVDPTPPPLPQQAAAAAGRCQPSQPTPLGWSLLDRAGYPGGAAADLGTVVDPWLACRIYRLTDAQTVERSLDGGGSWTTVFHDGVRAAYLATGDPACGAASVCTTSTPPFRASGLSVPAPDTVVLSEQANGDSVVISTDGGTTWTLRDSGLGGVPITTIRFAPGAPAIGYAYSGGSLSDSDVYNRSGTQKATALTDGMPAPGGLALYATQNGGQQWEARTTPAPVAAAQAGGSISIAVDRTDPQHLWLMAILQPRQPTNSTAGSVSSAAAPVPALAALTGTALYESHDGAQTWTQVTVPAAQITNQFAVLQSRNHPQRLVVVTSSTTSTTSNANIVTVSSTTTAKLSWSDNDGGTWHDAPLRSGFSPERVVADPGDNQRVLVVGVSDDPRASGAQEVHAYFSPDTLDTLVDAQSAPISSPVHEDLYGDNLTLDDIYGIDVAPLQADAAGSFYVSVARMCSGPPLMDGPDCPPNQVYDRSLWRINPPRLAAPPRLSTPAPTGGTGAPTARACPLPQPDGAFSSGSLAFDGRDLLYTRYGETGPIPGEAIIHRLDPVTCADAGSLVVRFQVRDLQAVQMAELQNEQCSEDRSRPWVDDMTYDARRNVLWISLGDDASNICGGPFGKASTSDGYGRIPYGLFTITVTDPRRGDAAALLATLNGCGQLLAYDYTDDSLWTCDASRRNENGAPLAHLDASTGTRIASCLDPLPPPTFGGEDVGWTLGLPGRLYVQREDDEWVEDLDTTTCSFTGAFQHRKFAEAPVEDEQLACDSLTQGRATNGRDRGTLLWVRDADAQTVQAYRINGRCPLPTFTRYLGPEQAHVGDRVSLCASLATRSLEGGGPVDAGLPMTISLDGTTTGGVATTTADGVACAAPTTLTVPPGVYATRALFAGNGQYLGSSGTGTLRVLPRPADTPRRHRNVPVAAALVVTVPPPPGASQPIGQAQSQSQAQGDVQAQAQMQSQTHVQSNVTLQPGVVPQRQHEVRVAVQTAAPDRQRLAYQASQRRRSRMSSGGSVLPIAAVLGLGLAAMRRRPAMARARRT